jgi:hypothetical protein
MVGRKNTDRRLEKLVQVTGLSTAPIDSELVERGANHRPTAAEEQQTFYPGPRWLNRRR